MTEFIIAKAEERKNTFDNPEYEYTPTSIPARKVEDIFSKKSMKVSIVIFCLFIYPRRIRI